MQQTEVVRIGADGWEEFRQVRLASFADAPEAFCSTYAEWVDAPENRWRRRMVDVPLTLVARSGGTPVGVACGAPAELDGAEAVELVSMWVSPAARGTGLVGRLIAGVVGWADAQGRPTFLMVRVGNDRARRAYERAGFVSTGVPADHPAGEPPEERMVRGRG